MVHPTCAHAHLPNDPPAHADSPSEPLPDPFELTMQAIREIKAARSAYHIVTCIQSISDASEARELMLLTDAEFKRRVEAALATLRSMRGPNGKRLSPATVAL
ncbi:hypothetical protein [Variovorax sp. Sphag1AA]|uniref:hypothetical protein n=1 Tax=Variovorax sp. Sphag1AA TaxID=2587027 RepID=UPI001617FDF9|nr:hypothetical protein [Variovorax sp. Sphag1AA]MBB3180280.1 hypothetical protein [Variovorax sp. Sphag1AA]